MTRWPSHVSQVSQTVHSKDNKIQPFFFSKNNFEGYSLAVLQIWGHLETGRFSCLSILVRHRGKIEQNNRLAT